MGSVIGPYSDTFQQRITTCTIFGDVPDMCTSQMLWICLFVDHISNEIDLYGIMEEFGNIYMFVFLQNECDCVYMTVLSKVDLYNILIYFKNIFTPNRQQMTYIPTALTWLVGLLSFVLLSGLLFSPCFGPISSISCMPMLSVWYFS